jgi:hypothetical protein
MAETGIRRFNSPLLAPSFQHKGVKSFTANATLTRHADSGKTLLLNAAAGLSAMVLPAAIGSGRRFRFVVGTTITSNTIVIKVANATDVFVGGIFINDIGDSTAATADFFPTAGTSDTITMTQSVGGGKKGDFVEIEDIAAGFFQVFGVMQGVTDPSTPFSATVS